MRADLRPRAMFAARAMVCGLALLGFCATVQAAEEPPHSAELDAMIIAQAKRHGVPEKLVRRVVMRESRYNPRARNHSFWGLMQISYPTAKSMGFKGSPQELLNPLVNLTYAVPYLANAFVIAGKHEDAAVRLYAAGYYNTARSRGLLGALRTAASDPVRGSGQPLEQPPIIATAYDTTSPAAPPVAAIAPAAGPAPTVTASGKDSSDGVDMVADRKGDMTPPKKWLRDGGTTVISRGEQRIEQVAAYAQANGTEKPERTSSRSRVHKTLTFASIDTPPAEAQAYAATPAQDPRLAQTESQAAIEQATSGRPTEAAPQPVADETPAPKTRATRTARKHSKAASETTDVAKADSNTASDDAADTKSSRHSKRTAAHKKAQALALRQAEEPATPSPQQAQPQQ